MKSPVSIARYAASAMLLWATGASAQFDQTISVDGRYVPEYIGREKIGMFPRPERFSINAGSLDFDRTGVVAALSLRSLFRSKPQAGAPRALKHHADTSTPASGSWLNSHSQLRLHDYRRLRHIRRSPVPAQFHLAVEPGDIRRKRRLPPALRRTHRFPLRRPVRCRDSRPTQDTIFGRFNYCGVIPSDGQSIPETSEDRGLWQTLNDVDARVRWDSPASSSRQVGYYAGAGARYFGWNRIYTVDASTLKGYGGVGKRISRSSPVLTGITVNRPSVST